MLLNIVYKLFQAFSILDVIIRHALFRGIYTAVMKESTDNSIQVTEIVVADGDIQSIFEKICEIRDTQVLGTPKIVMGDSC